MFRQVVHFYSAVYTDFDTYKSFLELSVGAIFKNANDPNRKIQYQPITTLSSGYDSACCSVLAKRNGCRDALTFINGADKSDAGTQIAKILGLHILEINRNEYLKSERNFIEAEIFSAGIGSSGLYMLSLDEHIQSRLLITGYQGDMVWDKVNPKVNSDLENDGSGSAYTEFRLRLGFINFILPHIGATQLPSIYRISNTEEMRRWSSGNDDYDRPIPTRIIMEENISRDLFGQSKKASSIYIYIHKISLKRIILKIIKILTPQRIENRIKLIQLKDMHKSIMKEESLKDLHRYWVKLNNPSIPSCNFIWGVDKIKNNYQ